MTEQNQQPPTVRIVGNTEALEKLTTALGEQIKARMAPLLQFGEEIHKQARWLENLSLGADTPQLAAWRGLTTVDPKHAARLDGLVASGAGFRATMALAAQGAGASAAPDVEKKVAHLRSVLDDLTPAPTHAAPAYVSTETLMLRELRAMNHKLERIAVAVEALAASEDES